MQNMENAGFNEAFFARRRKNIECLKFSHNGNAAVLGTKDGIFLSWIVGANEPIVRERNIRRLEQVDISRDGRTATFASQENLTRVIRLEEGGHEYRIDTRRHTSGVALANNGSTLIFADYLVGVPERSVIWKYSSIFEDMNQVAALEGHIRLLQCSEDANAILFCDEINTIHLIQFNGQAQHHRLFENNRLIFFRISLSREGTSVANVSGHSTSVYNNPYEFSFQANQVLPWPRGPHTNNTRYFSDLSEDGTIIMTMSNITASIHYLNNNQRLILLDIPPNSPYRLRIAAMSSDAGTVFASTNEGQWYLWRRPAAVIENMPIEDLFCRVLQQGVGVLGMEVLLRTIVRENVNSFRSFLLGHQILVIALRCGLIKLTDVIFREPGMMHFYDNLYGRFAAQMHGEPEEVQNWTLLIFRHADYLRLVRSYDALLLLRDAAAQIVPEIRRLEEIQDRHLTEMLQIRDQVIQQNHRINYLTQCLNEMRRNIDNQNSVQLVLSIAKFLFSVQPYAAVALGAVPLFAQIIQGEELAEAIQASDLSFVENVGSLLLDRREDQRIGVVLDEAVNRSELPGDRNELRNLLNRGETLLNRHTLQNNEVGGLNALLCSTTILYISSQAENVYMEWLNQQEIEENMNVNQSLNEVRNLLRYLDIFVDEIPTDDFNETTVRAIIRLGRDRRCDISSFANVVIDLYLQFMGDGKGIPIEFRREFRNAAHPDGFIPNALARYLIARWYNNVSNEELDNLGDTVTWEEIRDFIRNRAVNAI